MATCAYQECNQHNNRKTLVMVAESRRGLNVPFDALELCRKDCGKLFDQVWTITSLLQLLQDSNDDVIVDAFVVKLGVFC